MANKLLDEAGYQAQGATASRFEIVHDVTPYGEEWQRFGEYVAAGARQGRHQGDAALRGRADVAAPRLHRLRLPAHVELDPEPRRSGDRRASPVSSKSIKQGTVFVNDSRLELAGDRRADGAGDGRDRSEEARGALSRVPEARGRGGAARLGVRAQVRDRLQQEIQGPDREPARRLCVVRPGVARHSRQPAHRATTARARRDTVRMSPRGRARYVARRLRRPCRRSSSSSSLNFLLLHLAPGDAADVLAGEAGSATPRVHGAAAAPVRPRPAALRPALVYLKNVVTFDLGYSFRHGMPVRELILQRLGPTLLLMGDDARAVGRPRHPARHRSPRARANSLARQR